MVRQNKSQWLQSRQPKNDKTKSRKLRRFKPFLVPIGLTPLPELPKRLAA